jgi:hypothetical protein
LEPAAFEPTQLALRLVGAFYAFAGFIAARSALTSHFLDRAIAAIAAQKPKGVETAQAVWLLTAAFVILAGGAALMLLLDIAVWLFLASAVGQIAYTAPRYFDVGDPPDPDGRRRSYNAFVIYLAATAFVVWAYLTGRLLDWRAVPWQLLALFAAVVAGYAARTTWQLTRPFRPAYGAFGAAAGGEARHPSQSQRIKVMADYGCHPLWAMDDGLHGDFPPEDIGLSPELTRDLLQWADDFSPSFNEEDPAAGKWSETQYAAHETAGRSLAIRIARERPDLVVYTHTREHGVLEVHGNDET